MFKLYMLCCLFVLSKPTIITLFGFGISVWRRRAISKLNRSWLTARKALGCFLKATLKQCCEYWGKMQPCHDLRMYETKTTPASLRKCLLESYFGLTVFCRTYNFVTNADKYAGIIKYLIWYREYVFLNDTVSALAKWMYNHHNWTGNKILSDFQEIGEQT